MDTAFASIVVAILPKLQANSRICLDLSEHRHSEDALIRAVGKLVLQI